MSFFSKGFDNYKEELQVEEEKNQGSNEIFTFFLRVNETKEFIVLDDTGFRFYEYSFFNPTSRKAINFTARGENDFLSQAKKPSLVTVMTVKDMAGYIDKNGERKGVGDLKILKLKKNAAKRINILRENLVAQKAQALWDNHRQECESKGHKSVEEVAKAIIRAGDVLKLCRIRASRIAEKSEASGDDFSFVGKVKPEILKPTDVPVDYEKMFAPKSDDIIKAELVAHYGGVQNFDKHLINIKHLFDGVRGSSESTDENQTTQPSENRNNNYNQYETAPSYTDEEIPF